MKRVLKQQLKTAFDAPDSPRKEAFLRTLDYPKQSRMDFIKNQIKYISIWTWVAYLLLLVGVIWGFMNSSDNKNYDLRAIWIISSLLPFIFLVTMTELLRSSSFKMMELELSCKYNYTDIVIAKLLVMGLLSFVLFVLLLISFEGKTEYTLFRLGIYIYAPYLITCFMTFFTINRFSMRDKTYICAGIAVFVSLLNIIFNSQINGLFQNQFMQFCIVIFLLLVLSFEEVYRFIKNTEDSTWNLKLTV